MDTISYRLHNIEKYPIVLKSVQSLKGGKGVMLVPDIPEFKGETSLRKAFFNKDRDTFHLMAYNAKVHLPTSSGGVQIRYDESQKFISFECSMPKFFFGNNVCEIIPPMVSKYYSAGKLSMSELCADYWYKLMKITFRIIIRDLTQGLERLPDWSDVQLFRFDIAFNQIFNSEKDCMHYLDSIGRVSAPRIKDGKKVRYDNGNVTFQTENYYFKVYHKGTDFKHTGVNQIRKIFSDLGGKLQLKPNGQSVVVGNMLKEDSNILLSLNQIDNLQHYADKILRYELECTSKFLSYVFNTNLMKKNIPQYKHLFRSVTYIMREENYQLLKNLIVHYRTTDGKLHKTKPKLLLYDNEYSIPRYIIEPKCNPLIANDIVLVDHPQTIERIEKILRIVNSLRQRYLIKDFPMLKYVHKFLITEKSKERKFFFGNPKIPVEATQDGQPVIFLKEVVNSERALHPDAIPTGVHYDGDTMQLMQPTPQVQRFSKSNLLLCINKHNKLFSTLQFAQLPEIKDIELMCIEYNKHIDSLPRIKGKKREQKMHVNQMKTLFMAFKNNTWDDLRRSAFVSRKTLYNWKLKCEKLLGFQKNTNYIQNIDLENVPRTASNLYSRHYQEMMMPNNPLSLFMQSTQLLLFP